MNAKPHVALSALLFGTLAIAAPDGHALHWSYTGAAGPSHWGQLEPGFAMCARGHNQSPIDLTHAMDTPHAPIAFDYRDGGYRVVNNGHAVQIDFNPGSHMRVDGTDFALKQLHFHVPSEHTVDGKRFPMEAHLVHADAQGHLAVVAVLFGNGINNPWLERVGPYVPTKVNGTTAIATPVSAADLLPASRAYYLYDGSLTTPPCTEHVRWIVMKQPVVASGQEIALVHRAIGHDNNRPVQLAATRETRK
ncbi:carbonic anhydrase [Lysobacter claricitrinus]|uniref:carbonic anhydrase n=1 Tax=Lysobacter claricitrinus TaxID=3367728 RepID=UPI0037DA85D4